MRAVSVQALVVANVAFFVIVVVMGCLAIAATLAGLWWWTGSADDVQASVKEIESSSLFLCALFTILFVPAPLGAGYLAARIARRDHILNGALACGVWSLFNLAGLMFGPIFSESSDSGPTVPLLLEAILFYGTPLFGLVGGLLARGRDAERAAAGRELSAAAGLQQGARTVARWTVAVVAVLLAYTLSLVLAHALGTGNAALLAMVFGLALSIVVGVFVVRPEQRRTAARVFIALAVLLPAAKWIGHVAVGDPQLWQFFYSFINLLGAGISWVYLKRTFPEQFPSRPGPWWWLTTFEFARWSVSERKARIALGFSGLAAALICFLAVYAAALWSGAGDNVALPAAALACLPAGLLAARPIATWLFPAWSARRTPTPRRGSPAITRCFSERMRQPGTSASGRRANRSPWRRAPGRAGRDAP